MLIELANWWEKSSWRAAWNVTESSAEFFYTRPLFFCIFGCGLKQIEWAKHWNIPVTWLCSFTNHWYVGLCVNVKDFITLMNETFFLSLSSRVAFVVIAWKWATCGRAPMSNSIIYNSKKDLKVSWDARWEEGELRSFMTYFREAFTDWRIPISKSCIDSVATPRFTIFSSVFWMKTKIVKWEK